MREILFRAKTVCDGDWVYGGITWNPSRKKMFIHSDFEECKVIPETVGQFTGLTDIHRVKIFEQDIVKAYDPCEGKPIIGVIKFGDGSFYMCDTDFNSYYRWMDYEVEVIGNVWDNPELMEGDKT